jgi:hypothetical protein
MEESLMVANSGGVDGRSVLAGGVDRAPLRALWLAAAAATLVACGGGSSGSGSLPPASKGSVVVRLITTAGVPVSGMSVALNGGFDGLAATTDANGEASFKDIPAGEASANVGGHGYHVAFRRFTVAKEGPGTRVTVPLQRVTEAVPVLLATYPATPSADGRLLTVEADVAILTADGSSRADLVAADFGLECATFNYVCVVASNGLALGGYLAFASAASFNTVAVPPGASSAVGVLIEQSGAMETYDPQGLRLQAVRDYFDRVLPPNLVTLASQRDTGTAPILTTYGGFTSDGSRFRNAIDGLRGQEAGDSRTREAIAEMAGFMQASLTGATGSPRQAMVVMTSSEPGCPNPFDPSTCESSLRSAVETAQAAGISVIVAGDPNSVPFDVAASTGGASVAIVDPAQWPVLVRALDPLVLGGLPHYRVRFELAADKSGVFIKGARVRGELTIRVGTDTRLWPWYIEIPI